MQGVTDTTLCNFVTERTNVISEHTSCQKTSQFSHTYFFFTIFMER